MSAFLQYDWVSVARFVVGAFRIDAVRAGAAADVEPLVELGDLRWVRAGGKPASYGTNGAGVAGLRGEAAFLFAGDKTIRVSAEGTWFPDCAAR